VKSLIKKILNKFGLDIIKLEKVSSSDNPYSQLSKENHEIIDIEMLGKMSLTIPGMITPQAGKFLYALCYMQNIKGDVVEIGSWQGRSSTFLARAVKESKNGNFYAIDHFGGNVGKESFYKVEGTLNGLKDNFNHNISKFGLSDVVHLLDMHTTEAAKQLEENTIRFLFIDGDHTKEGVRRDIELFFPRLIKGSIIVFDDYFDGFPGLVESVDELFAQYTFDKVFYHRHTLVVQL